MAQTIPAKCPLKQLWANFHAVIGLAQLLGSAYKQLMEINSKSYGIVIAPLPS
jgi:hypothetical protein